MASSRMAVANFRTLIRDARLRAMSFDELAERFPYKPEPDIIRCEGARLAQGNALKPPKWMQPYAGWTCSYCDLPTYQREKHRYAMFYHQVCAEMAAWRNRVFDE